ncbi:MAG: RAMP superfamily CRISPR-associated protein [Methylocella sp.]
MRGLLGRMLRLIETDGLTLGRGTGDGQGRVRVTKLNPASYVLDGNGELLPEIGFDNKALLPADHGFAKKGEVVVLTLTCDGPFFVNDYSWNPKKDSDKPQLRALRRSETEPIVPGTSLMGALRARATWISRREMMRREISDVEAKAAVVEAKAAVEFLFSSSEQRGALRLDCLGLLDAGRAATLTSVKLDRFSGVPIDGALFAVECSANTGFEATLRLVNSDQAPEQARSLRRSLLDDLKKNGLMLGHAANRGFGWFHVENKAKERT